MTLKNLNKSAHVGAFKMVRQIGIETNGSRSILDLVVAIFDYYRVAQILDTNFVDGQISRVGAILNILQGHLNCQVHRNVMVSHSRYHRVV